MLVRDLCVSLFVEEPGEVLRHRRYLGPLDIDLSLLTLGDDEVYLTQLVTRTIIVEAPLRPAPLLALKSRAQDYLGDLGQVPDVLRGVPARVEERRALGLHVWHPLLDLQDLLEPLLQGFLVAHQVGVLHHRLLDLLLKLVGVLPSCLSNGSRTRCFSVSIWEESISVE